MHLVALVLLGQQVEMGHLFTKETLVQVVLVQQAARVPLVFKATLGQWGTLVPKVFRDLQGARVAQVRRAQEVKRDLLDVQVHKVQRVNRVVLVKWAAQGHVGWLGTLEKEALKEMQVQLVHVVALVLVVRSDTLEAQVHVDAQVPVDAQVARVILE